MNVKVSKEKLVKAIQAKRDDLVKAHVAQAKAFSADWAAYKKRLRDWLGKYDAAVVKSESPEDLKAFYRYGDSKQPEPPTKPTTPRTEKFDRVLATLAIVHEDIITLNDNRDSDFLDLL